MWNTDIRDDVLDYAKKILEEVILSRLVKLSKEEYLRYMHDLFSTEILEKLDYYMSNSIPDDVIDKCIEIQQFCFENKVQVPIGDLSNTIGEKNAYKLYLIGTFTTKGPMSYVWWDYRSNFSISKIIYFRDMEKSRYN